MSRDDEAPIAVKKETVREVYEKKLPPIEESMEKCAEVSPCVIDIDKPLEQCIVVVLLEGHGEDNFDELVQCDDDIEDFPLGILP